MHGWHDMVLLHCFFWGGNICFKTHWKSTPNLDGKRSTTRTGQFRPEVIPSSSWVNTDLVAATPLCWTFVGSLPKLKHIFFGIALDVFQKNFSWLEKEQVYIYIYFKGQGTRQWGAKGFSGSGLTSSLTRERSIPEIEPKSARLFAQTLVFEAPCDTIAARPKLRAGDLWEISCWLGRVIFPKQNETTSCYHSFQICLLTRGLESLIKNQGALLAFLSSVPPMSAVRKIHCHFIHIHAPKVFNLKTKSQMGKCA